MNIRFRKAVHIAWQYKGYSINIHIFISLEKLQLRNIISCGFYNEILNLHDQIDWGKYSGI